MKKSGLIAVTFLTLAGTTANADPGFSIGASAGYGIIFESASTPDFDANDLGFKIFGNYMFNNFIGVEGGYVDFGGPDADILGTNFAIEATGWNAYLVGNLPLGNTFDLFAKAGAVKWDTNSLIDGISVSTYDGSDLALSGGARLNFGRFGIRAEVDWYDIADSDKAMMASFGLEFRF